MASEAQLGLEPPSGDDDAAAGFPTNEQSELGAPSGTLLRTLNADAFSFGTKGCAQGFKVKLPTNGSELTSIKLQYREKKGTKKNWRDADHGVQKSEWEVLQEGDTLFSAADLRHLFSAADRATKELRVRILGSEAGRSVAWTSHGLKLGAPKSSGGGSGAATNEAALVAEPQATGMDVDVAGDCDPFTHGVFGHNVY